MPDTGLMVRAVLGIAGLVLVLATLQWIFSHPAFFVPVILLVGGGTAGWVYYRRNRNRV